MLREGRNGWAKKSIQVSRTGRTLLQDWQNSPSNVKYAALFERRISFTAFSYDGVHHWLDFRRRAGDDAKDFAGRSLLLQSFGEFAVARFEFLA